MADGDGSCLSWSRSSSGDGMVRLGAVRRGHASSSKGLAQRGGA